MSVTNAGMNWLDMDVLSDAGINWDGYRCVKRYGLTGRMINVMSDMGINWVSVI